MDELRLSISRLARELSMDRRTVTKRLAGVESSGEEGGYPVYALGPAVRAILGVEGPGNADVLRHRLLVAQTKKAEIEAQKLEKSVIDVSKMESAAMQRGIREREALEQFFGRLGDDLAADLALDAKELTIAIEQRLHDFLEGRANASV